MNTTENLVCIVDDEASIRTSLSRFFRSVGWAAEQFESAGDYLARSSHPGPSCLVLDVHMPEFDGLALQRALLERGRDEQVVFITGDGDIPTCAHAMKAGAVDFLQKPFGDDDLLAAVERALGRSRTQWARKMESESARRRVALLTPREFQVFQRVIAGMMNKHIAAELGTALKTVKVQRGRVMEKMGVVSVAELVRVAQQAGVLAPGGS